MVIEFRYMKFNIFSAVHFSGVEVRISQFPRQAIRKLFAYRNVVQQNAKPTRHNSKSQTLSRLDRSGLSR